MSDFKAKCTKFDFGLHPRPSWGSLQRSPDPLAGFKGPTSKGGRGREGRERPTYKGREVKGGSGSKGRGGKRMEGEGKGNGGAYL